MEDAHRASISGKWKLPDRDTTFINPSSRTLPLSSLREPLKGLSPSSHLESFTNEPHPIYKPQEQCFLIPKSTSPSPTLKTTLKPKPTIRPHTHPQMPHSMLISFPAFQRTLGLAWLWSAFQESLSVIWRCFNGCEGCKNRPTLVKCNFCPDADDWERSEYCTFCEKWAKCDECVKREWLEICF